MTSEKKLTITAATTLGATMLFAYFTFSVNKWTNGVEESNAKAWDVIQAHEPRLIKLESNLLHVQETNADIKQSITKLEGKIDRLLDLNLKQNQGQK